MKKRISTILLIVTIIVTQFVYINPIEGTIGSAKSLDQQIDTKYQSTDDVIPPAPYGGVEPIQSNHLRNGGFEESAGDNEPSDFTSGGTTAIIINSEYQTEVHAGTYSAYMKVEGNGQSSSYAENRRSFSEFGDRAYIDEVLELDFWYNCKANPDIATSGQVYIRFQIMSDIGNIYIHYYLSSSSFPDSNTTYYGFFDVRGSLDSWININRNFTDDFVSAFPTRVLSQSYIRTIYFDCYSPENPTGAIELLIDDVGITNDTAFDYFSDNGDFENGDSSNWSTLQTDNGYAYLTENDYTKGSKSMNLTSYSTAADSYSTSYLNRYHSQGYGTFPKGLFAQQSEEYLIDFNWKYIDTSSSLIEYSYFYLACQNETFTANIYIVLGDSTDSLSNFGNYTASNYVSRYIKAENFSITNDWNHFSIDYFDLLQSLGLSNLATNTIQFTAYSEGTDARVQLLIDELTLLVYPLSDPSFENNWEWQSNDPLLAWLTNSNDNYVNRTSDAFSGNYAANITSYGGIDSYCQRNMFLPVDDNQFLDFRWRLDEITNNGGEVYSHITMQIDSGFRTVYYILGRNNDASYTNSTNRVCYYVENFNTTGVWMNLFRNVSNDIITPFGDSYNWNITTIQLQSKADGSNVVSTIFDDLHFVEDNAGPTITNPTITPSLPENDDSVDVTVDVFDSSQVDIVELHYQIGAGSWVTIPMTFVAGKYLATIPSADFGETVGYYFTADDVYNYTSQLGTESSPYTYVVGDDTFPVVVITSPTPLAVISNDVLIQADVSDGGSGIDYVEFFDGSTSLGTDYSAPFNFLWSTRTVINGEHTIIVMAHDNVGLANGSSVIVNIDNDKDPPVMSNLRQNPTVPEANTPVQLLVEVTDESGVKYVQIFYRIDSGTWIRENMTLVSGNYTGEIPSIGYGSKVDYFIKACDNYNYVEFIGNTADFFSYEIPYTARVIFLWFVLPIGLGIVAIGVGTFFLVRFVKRRKVA
ncbi:MAG: Ig-like domain-containing protein [Candidatus Heimdallarchaeota archaeon]